jgi:hypothetical protein
VRIHRNHTAPAPPGSFGAGGNQVLGKAKQRPRFAATRFRYGQQLPVE